MPLELGAAFAPIRREEPEQPRQVDVESLRAEQLLSALAALHEALSNMPAPVVNVAEPDLSAIVQAVTQLNGPASPEDIAAAIKAELDPSPQPTVEPVLRDLTAALEKLDFRLKGLNTGGGGTVPSTYDIRDRAERVLGVVTGPMTAAQAISTPVRIREGLAYYASGDGGRVAFNASTNILSISGSGEQPLCAFQNPAGSGMDVLLWFGEFSSSIDTNFRRYRGATISATGTAQTAANMGGGTATSVAKLLVPGQYTATGGTVSKTAQIGAYDQYVADIHFSTRLRPGQGIRWTINGPGGNPSYTAAVYLEWAEIVAEA